MRDSSIIIALFALLVSIATFSLIQMARYLAAAMAFGLVAAQ